MKRQLLVAVVLAVVVAMGSSSSALATYMTGGDAATQAAADAVLDIVFTIDTSGSMFDDINAIGNVAQNVVTNLDCPKGDIWVRARFMSFTTYTYGIFNEPITTYVTAKGGTPVTNHSEDNGPAVTDLVNWYNWNDDTAADQDYYKAIVTIGDEGTENGYPVYQDDWDAAYVANQAAIANDVMVFGWVADPYPGVEAVFRAMSEGGTGYGYTFGDTGGLFTNYNAAQGAELEAEIERIICTAGGGGTTVIPEPGTFVIWGLGLLSVVGFGWFRRKRAA